VQRDTGLAALPLLDAGGIDLVVPDVGLPDISGFDLLKRIRAVHSTPVILLTAQRRTGQGPGPRDRRG
jgi:two-component system catabolic regulation response regulator CreB